MPEHTIEVSHITKRFKVYYDKGYNLKERVLFRKRNRFEWRNVIDDISFHVDKGEAVGLIGHNGCGKSTTLKLLTRIMYPDSGTVRIKGRVSSLIELGAGFHPDMSGRENIYINAAIFGLSRKEIDRRIDGIVEFSELGSYIDNPVRTYSSGMYMRLAFSIAINVDADVLLVDEILAVGDYNFQQKCLHHMYELKSKGVTIVIVTHDTDMVSRFCDRAIWINNGKIEWMDKASVVAQKYVDYMASLQYDQAQGSRITLDGAYSAPVQDETSRDENDGELTSPPGNENWADAAPEASADGHPTAGNELSDAKALIPATASPDASHHGDFSVVITDAGWLTEDGKRTTVLRAGKPASIMIEFTVREEQECRLICGICINTLDKKCIYGVNTQLDDFEPVVSENKGRVICHFGSVDLFPGKYELQVAVHGNDDHLYDFYMKYNEFTVVSDQRYKGVMQIRHHWSTEPV